MMHKLSKRLIAIVVCGALSACGYTIVKNGPMKVSNNVAINTDIEWSRQTFGDHEFWTRDGHNLQELWFVKSVSNGQHLVPTNIGGKPSQPEFDPDMALIEVPTFVKDSYLAQGFQQFEYQDVTPHEFAGQPGFKATFTFVTLNGVDKQGIFVGAIIERRLTLIVYTGLTGFYFDRYLDDVEKIFESATTPA